MKLAGITGGLGPESTIDYYRVFFEEMRKVAPDAGAPRLLIDSVDVQPLIAWVGAGARREMVDYLLESLSRLASGGADFALIAANTPHLVFDDLVERSPVPLLSIVECAAAEVQRRGLRRPLLFGTKFTMSSRFYPEVFERRQMDLVVPTPEEQERIHSIYLDELLLGIVRDDSRATLLEILYAVRERDGIDSVILGGTELPLILREEKYGGVVVLDTTRIHVQAAVERMLEKESLR